MEKTGAGRATLDRMIASRAAAAKRSAFAGLRMEEARRTRAIRMANDNRIHGKAV